MPVSHGIEHGANWIQPWPLREVVDPATQQKVLADFSIRKTWTSYGKQPTQYFGLYSDYGFMGAWYADEGINRLRISDSGNDPGMKIYCAPGMTMCEPWGGTTVVFEDPGGFVEGFAPCGMTHAYYLVSGLGPALSRR
jgi:hypothetical protein